MAKSGTYFGINEDGVVTAAAHFGNLMGPEASARKFVARGGRLALRVEDNDPIRGKMYHSMKTGEPLDPSDVFNRCPDGE